MCLEFNIRISIYWVISILKWIFQHRALGECRLVPLGGKGLTDKVLLFGS